jgi:hypothetical protein
MQRVGHGTEYRRVAKELVFAWCRYARHRICMQFQGDEWKLYQDLT